MDNSRRIHCFNAYCKNGLAGIFTAIILLPASSQPCFAEMFFVTNASQDNIECGSISQPCRSISQAINNAEAGDHIMVGPGIYGDINNDGDFDDPGEEMAQLDIGCHCMILVNKSLTITSIVGASYTTISANGAITDLVKIIADNVTFGETRHGFTLTGANPDIQARGLINRGAGLSAVGSYINIMGNLAKNNGGPGFLLSGNEHRVIDNESKNNAAGFTFGYTEHGHIVQDNLAHNNGNSNATGHGFSFYGHEYQVSYNLAMTNNGMGFVINAHDEFDFEYNTAFGNTGQGVFKFVGPEIKTLKNNIFGNLDKDNLL